MKTQRTVNVFMFIFLVATWLLMCGNNVYLIYKNNVEFAFGPLDVVRRVTAPDGQKTAILVRSYGSLIDLNFALYISDHSMVDISDSTAKAMFIPDPERSSRDNAAIWIKRALWISHDYDSTTSRNWHEDIVWSNDGAIIAVIIEEQYIFAYDFNKSQGYENPEKIDELLKLHSK